MPGRQALDDHDDDYVVSLLLRDAETSQKRHAPSGFDPFAPRRPQNNAPKPNTRFLRQIIRETDSHNTALKTKAEDDSRARLEEMSKRTFSGRKRSREDDGDGPPTEQEKRPRQGERSGRWTSVLSGLGESRDRESKRRGQRLADHSDGERRSRRRTRDEYDDDDYEYYRQRERERERERRRSRTRHRQHHHQRHPHGPERKRSGHASDTPSPTSTAPTTPERDPVSQDNSMDIDSDPLDEIIGPQPPPTVLPRGRGAQNRSTIDSRFHLNYDPMTDVGLDDAGEPDDWDMALEALKDRAKWKARGGERLRTAGFTDEEVKRFEKGGVAEVEDIRWRQKGEGREWDRGKVVDGEAFRLKTDW